MFRVAAVCAARVFCSFVAWTRFTERDVRPRPVRVNATMQAMTQVERLKAGLEYGFEHKYFLRTENPAIETRDKYYTILEPCLF